MAISSKADAEHGIVAGNFVNAAVQVSMNTDNVATAALPAGLYRVVSTVDCYIRQATAAATATATFLPKNVVDYFAVVDASDNVLNTIVASGTGTLHLTKRNEA